MFERIKSVIASRLQRDNDTQEDLPPQQPRETPQREYDPFSYSSTFTEEDVLYIRKMYSEGNLDLNVEAEKFGVHPESIRNVVVGKTFKKVKGVTYQFNPNMMVRKRAVLTEEVVVEIRRLHDLDGSYTNRRLAEMFDISSSAVGDIVTNATWKDLPHAKDPKYIPNKCSTSPKFLMEEVVFIRDMSKNPVYQLTTLAKLFDVSPSTIRNIWKGQLYKDAGGYIRKGKRRWKRKDPDAPITKEQEKEIKTLYASFAIPLDRIVAFYEVPEKTIVDILKEH